MNKLLKYPLFLLFTALASCSSDDDALPASHPVAPPRGDALAVTITARDFVTDGAPDTRATDNGKETTFENDDRVGIIILDNKERPLYNNIPYKYVSSSHTWIAADTEKGACYYDPQAHTYIVYYPYSANADGCKNESDLKAIFKPQTDQSTKEAYRASDLMVYTTTTSVVPKTSLKAELKHVYASISLAPTTTGAKYVLEGGESYDGSYVPGDVDISDVNLTVGNDIYILYRTADGSIRCILPTGIASGKIRCFYTIGSNTYSNEINMPQTDSNKRYTSSTKIENVIYSLENAHVGDFYCINDKKEGYLIPGDVTTLTEEQQKACIGIVFWAGDATQKDKTLKVDHPNCTHGLVLALYDSQNAVVWQQNEYEIQDWLDANRKNMYHPFSSGENEEDVFLNNIQGYNNTKALEDFNTAMSEYTVNAVSVVADYRTKYQAPANSSNWYLPSIKELTLVCGEDIDDIVNFKENGGTTNRDLINDKLELINGATKIETSGMCVYWSSTETAIMTINNVYYMNFVTLDMAHEGKMQSSDLKIRSILAF